MEHQEGIDVLRLLRHIPDDGLQHVCHRTPDGRTPAGSGDSQDTMLSGIIHLRHEGTAWYKLFDLCFYILSVKFVEKLPFIKDRSENVQAYEN